MASPRYRKQFDDARDPYSARNALGVTTWLSVDESARAASTYKPETYGGAYELVAGTGVTFSFTPPNAVFGSGAAQRTRKIVTLNATATGVSSINGLTGAVTIAAGTGINLSSAGTTITISAPLFGTSAQGEVPASGGGTVNFLRADGTWANAIQTLNSISGQSNFVLSATPPVNVSFTAPNTLTWFVNLFTTSTSGIVPASGGGTANFLRADASWALPYTRGQYVGTNTNDNATAGNIGEYVVGTVTTPAGLSNGIAQSISSISLSACDWDVQGVVGFQPASGTGVNALHVCVSSSVNFLDTSTTVYGSMPCFGLQPQTYLTTTAIHTPVARFSLASTTTIYVNGVAVFTGATNAIGTIRARRVR